MNRRRFLSWLTGTAAGVALAPTLDVEKLLWVPGERTIFLPSAVDLPTIPPEFWDKFADEWVRQMDANLQFVSRIHRDYDRVNVGETVQIRLPQRWEATIRRDAADKYVPITISKVYEVGG